MTDRFDAPATTPVQENVRRLIAKTLDIDEAEVVPSLGVHDVPEWSSLEHVTLMMAIEDGFGVRIDGPAVARLTSVGTIEEFLGAAEEEPTEEAQSAAAVEPKSDRAQPEARDGRSDPPEIHRGLDGIYFDESGVSHIDGTNSELLIRGYPIEQLAADATFEEVAFLVVRGQRPDRGQLATFEQRLIEQQQLPPSVIDVVEAMAYNHPMAAIRTGLSMLGECGPDAKPGDPTEALDQGINAAAKIPTILATHHAARHRRSRPTMSTAPATAQRFLDSFLDRRTRPTEVEAVDLALRLLVDHGANASTFAAMVTAAAGNDVIGSLVAATATLSGARHGGAVEGSIQVIREVGGPAGATRYVEVKRARREPVMGFGHRVYRTADPRTAPLRAMAEQLSDEINNRAALDTMAAVEDAMAPYQRHGLHMNVDSYLAVVLHLIGIPDDYFSSFYAMGRIYGWIAHVIEQYERNVLIRPRLAYQGPARRSWTEAS